MTKKKTEQNTNIKDAKPLEPEEMYITWGENLASKRQALQKSSESLEEFNGLQRSVGYARYSRNYSDLAENTSSRPGLTRSDYDYFRPHEAVPHHIKNIMKAADEIYQKVGLVKNVIDLMGDFGSQGIRIVHKNPRIERFFRNWFEKVGGPERSERFLNNLYRVGNVVVNRQTAKLNKKTADNMYKAVASPDLIAIDDTPTLSKTEIPWRYTFMDPYYVDAIGDSLGSFVGNKLYAINLPANLRKQINSPKDKTEKQIVSQLPADIIAAAKEKTAVLLDINKTSVFHYKKDDWLSWAYPMIYAIMDDIGIIEKLKLADLAALDGAISNIRIFKLGNLDHKIAPTKAAAAKLSNILQNNVGGGTMDLIWGPDIELVESNTNVHQFLGEAKYTPHLNSVYAGLGIPPTLTGTYGAAGTTNNFISLKTLTQRLDYGRNVLTEFWRQEIKIVQKAMGFRYPARIEFDKMDLSNEDAEKALLIQLADRSLISDELLQKRFGFDPDMETTRINRENKQRDSKKRAQKSGPFYDPEFEKAMKKILLQSGTVSPGQLGMELKNKKRGDKSPEEIKSDLASKISQTKLTKDSSESLPGEPGEGRPRLSKDKEKRKTKQFKPRTGAAMNVWSLELQDKISNIINPIVLEFFNKKTIRSMSNKECQYLDRIKTEVLFSAKPFVNMGQADIRSIFDKNNDIELNSVIRKYNQWVHSVANHLGRTLTTEELKTIKSEFYCYINKVS